MAMAKGDLARRLAVVCVAVVAASVAGCSENDSARSTVTSSLPATETQEHPRTTTDDKKRHPEASPTRLIGGPLIFRITGAPRPTETDLTAEVAYTLVFRLNRRAIRGGSSHSYGYFAVAGGAVDVYLFGPRRRNCFAADLRRADDEFDPAVMRRLDAIEFGSPVRVEIKPRTPERGATAQPGRRYVRLPSLRTATFRLNDSLAQGQLKRIGCSGLTS